VTKDIEAVLRKIEYWHQASIAESASEENEAEPTAAAE
jgi:hypothetical protein